MKCRKCGAELADGVLFCRECGTKVELKIRFCRECGAELEDGAKFCTNCGASMELPEKKEEPVEKEDTAVVEEEIYESEEEPAGEPDITEKLKASAWEVWERIKEIAEKTLPAVVSVWEEQKKRLTPYYEDIKKKVEKHEMLILCVFLWGLVFVLLFTLMGSIGSRPVTKEEPQKNDVTIPTNELYTIGSFTMEIPQYWQDGETADDNIVRYVETGDTKAFLQIIVQEIADYNEPVTSEVLLMYNDAVFEGLGEGSVKEMSEPEATDTGYVNGIRTKVTLNESEDGSSKYAEWFLFGSEENGMVYCILFGETTKKEFVYPDDFEKMIYSIRPVENTDTSEVEEPKQPVSYSTNTEDTVGNGNEGVYAYKKSGSSDMYLIVDFEEDCVYLFTEGNGDSSCKRTKIDSGDLNSKLVFSFNNEQLYGLRFKQENDPEYLVFEMNNSIYEFGTTDLQEALRIRDTKTIREY